VLPCCPPPRAIFVERERGTQDKCLQTFARANELMNLGRVELFLCHTTSEIQSSPQNGKIERHLTWLLCVCVRTPQIRFLRSTEFTYLESNKSTVWSMGLS
jgi:hypothetical protein